MNNRTNHIFRSITITCLMAGFLAHLIVPFSSQAQKTAFTRWLNHNVVSSGNESEIKLRNTIKELPEQAGDFWGLIQEASELVANHKDHFKILVSTPNDTNGRAKSNWLIDQWNIFQNQKSGFNSVFTEQGKTLSKWIPQHLDLSLWKNYSGSNQYDYFREKLFYSFNGSVNLIQPLVSGISIHAP